MRAVQQQLPHLFPLNSLLRESVDSSCQSFDIHYATSRCGAFRARVAQLPQDSPFENFISFFNFFISRHHQPNNLSLPLVRQELAMPIELIICGGLATVTAVLITAHLERRWAVKRL